MAKHREGKKPERTGPAAPASRSQLEFYADDDGKELGLEWPRGLSLTKRQVLGQAMNEVLQTLGEGRKEAAS